jgi:hypothetical protein
MSGEIGQLARRRKGPEKPMPLAPCRRPSRAASAPAHKAPMDLTMTASSNLVSWRRAEKDER